MSLAQYPGLKEAATKIKDQELIDLVASLEPLLGTDDGKPETHFLPNYANVLKAFSESEKLSTVVKQSGNKITKKWLPAAINYQRVAAYANNLFPFVNDDGDAIINAIFDRVIELVK
jgi:hypothetical protein